MADVSVGQILESFDRVLHNDDGLTRCSACTKVLEVGDWPFCPHQKPEFGAHGVVGDECDIWIKHGLCEANGDPKHYTSRKEIAAEAKRRGMVNMVRTLTTPGPNAHRKVFGMRGHTKGSTQT